MLFHDLANPRPKPPSHPLVAPSLTSCGQNTHNSESFPDPANNIHLSAAPNHWYTRGMFPLPAYAQPTDTSDANLSFILIALGLFILTALLALLPIALSHARYHRHARAILMSALLWGFLTAGSAILTANAHLQWSAEHLRDLKTGYLDPADTTGAPAWPWPLWIIMAVVYLALLLAALSQDHRPSPNPSQPE
jgi:hypothetical protein